MSTEPQMQNAAGPVRALETRPEQRGGREFTPATGRSRGWSPPVPPDSGRDTAGHAFGRVHVHRAEARNHPVVGRPDDCYEVEAKAAADRAMAVNADTARGELMPARHPAGRFQAAAVQSRVPAATPGLERQIKRAGAEARPLPAEQRSFYEDRLGHDFGSVRVHAGPASAAAAASLGAQAFTHGQDIYFGAGYFRPGSVEGQHLMAHELAHSVQQASTQDAPAPAIQRQAVTPDVIPFDPVIPSADESANLQPPPKDGDAQAATDQAKHAGLAGESLPQRQRADQAAEEDGRTASQGAVEEQATSTVKSSQKAATESSPEGKAGAQAAPIGHEGEELAVDQPSEFAGVATGDLALIDKELAEHQRWGTANAQVGAAGSGERAKFVSEAAGEGSGFAAGLIQGAGMGAGIKLGEKLIEKGAVKLATKAAVRLGTQVAKFTPLPAVGAVIGGVLSAYELSKRDWKATGEAIGRFGKGASIYDTLANSIESVSTVIDVATQILNVIAGVIGAISIAMWIITVLTVGIASPLAATLSTISAGIGLATLALDAINALVLKQLITIFRSLHAFTSEADPRDVVTQGAAIGQAAGAATGFVGGFVGGIAGGGLAEKGAKKLSSKKPSTPVPDHPNPTAASGEGPTVKAEVKEAGAAPKEPSTTALGGEPAAKAGPVEAVAPTKETNTAPVEPDAAAKPRAPVLAEAQPSGTMDIGPGKAKAKSERQLTRKQLKELAQKNDLTDSDVKALAEHLGVSVEETRSLLIKVEHARTVKGLRETSRAGGLVGPDYQNLPGKQKPYLRRGEKLPGRPEVDPRVKASQRSIARKRFGLDLQEALKDPSKGNNLTRLTERYLTEKQKNYVLRAGKLPSDFQFHHFLTIADFPEFGHLAEVGAALPERVHKEVGHGGDTTRPLEAATFLDPDAETRPPFHNDPLSQKNARRQPTEIAKGSQSSGNVDKDIAIQLRTDLKDLKSRAAKDPSPKLTKEISAREALLQVLDPSGVSLVTPAAPSTPVSATISVPEPAPTLQVGQPTTPPFTAKATPARLGPEGLSSLSYLSPAAHAGEQAGVDGGVPGFAFNEEMPELGRVESGPVTEHVNPNYPAPPATPQLIIDVQNQILETLDARAEAEAASATMAKQEAAHKANEKPLARMGERTAEAISATEAHKQAVARRTEANQNKTKKETEVSNTLSTYYAQAGKLAAITVPMKGFERFTSLAHSLPDSPEVLVDAKRGILNMNADSKRFLAQLDSVDQTINSQKAGQEDRNRQTEGDANTLSQTDTRAKDSGENLTKAQETTKDFTNENTTRLDDARKLRTEGDRNAKTLESQEQQKRAEAASLASSLRTWAQNHRQARLDALKMTQESLEQQGYKVTDVKET